MKQKQRTGRYKKKKNTLKQGGNMQGKKKLEMLQKIRVRRWDISIKNIQESKQALVQNGTSVYGWWHYEQHTMIP